MKTNGHHHPAANGIAKPPPSVTESTLERYERFLDERHVLEKRLAVVNQAVLANGRALATEDQSYCPTCGERATRTAHFDGEAKGERHQKRECPNGHAWRTDRPRRAESRT